MHSQFTIDCVILSFDNGKLQVLLTERNEYPYKDWWSIPGYFVDKYEEMEDAVYRICHEMTGLKNIYMDQLAAFAGVKRHPEGRILTVAYLAFVQFDSIKNKIKPVSTYMKQAKWCAADELPDLAFDHLEIVTKSLDRLKNTISYSASLYELLPEKFTLTQLQQLHEAILGKTLDKRNFRKKINTLGYLKPLDEYQKGVSYRAAKLYKLDKRKFQKVIGQG